MNVQQALTNGTQLLRDFKVPSAELDAEILLAHAVSKNRTKLYSDSDLPLTESQRKVFNDLLARRASREPVAYLVGEREFYGLPFYISRQVLIPRPETERLVEIALKRLEEMGTARPRLADIGTGSGAIAIAIASNDKKVKVTALDLSPEALKLARRNAKRHKVFQSISFKRSDLLSEAGGPFDLIVANLPYLTNRQITDLPNDIKEYEPRLALAGGPDGLHIYERLLGQLQNATHEASIVLCEIGPNLKTGFEQLVKCLLPQETRVRFYDDLAGRTRVAEITFGQLR